METKPLFIPKKFRKLKLKVSCGRCGTWVYDHCKIANKEISKCPHHGDKHKFKIVVYEPNSKIRRTLVLSTRKLSEAIPLAIEFEQKIKQQNNPTIPEIKPEMKIKGNERQPILLTDCMARFMAYLQNDPAVVPEHERGRELSLQYVKDYSRTLKEFAACLQKNNYDLKTLRIDQLDKFMTGKFHQHILETKPGKMRTYNVYFNNLRAFVNYFISEGYELKNVFERVKKYSFSPKIEVITQEEYQKLLEIVQNPELGKQALSTGEVKSHFKDWLYDAIVLGGNSGRRRSEILSIRHGDVLDSEGVIKVEDIKSNKLKKISGDNKKYLFIPLNSALRSLLEKLNHGTEQPDRYLIGPDEAMSRKSMENFLTKAFSIYYKKLGTGRDLTWRSLRRSYATELSKQIGIENAHKIVGHSNIKVLKEHYISSKEMAKAVAGKDFDVFGENSKESNRMEELENTRQKTYDKQQSLER